MNITPNVLRAFAQAFQLVADALDQPQAQPGMVPLLNLVPAPVAAPVAEAAPKAKRAPKGPFSSRPHVQEGTIRPDVKPAPVASDDDDEAPAKKPAPVTSDDDDDMPVVKVKPSTNDDDDETPAPKAEAIKKPAPASDDDDEAPPAPKAKPAPAVSFPMLRAEAAALLVAYVDEHGMSLAAKVLRKHGADKVSKVADVSLQSLVDALKAGEPE